MTSRHNFHWAFMRDQVAVDASKSLFLCGEGCSVADFGCTVWCRSCAEAAGYCDSPEPSWKDLATNS